MPATRGSTLAASLLSAGVLNFAASFPPLFFFVRHTALLVGASNFTRRWALLLALAAWPGSAALFIQPNTRAVGFGLLSLLPLANATAPPSARAGWSAALLCAAAARSKQTETALAFAHLSYLAVRFGFRAALFHAFRLAAAGGAVLARFGWGFGFEGLWFNTVALPAAIPSGPLLPKINESNYLNLGLVTLAAPPLGLLLARRPILRRRSPYLLFALAYLCTVPTNILGFVTYGGTSNALHAQLHLTPILAVLAAGTFTSARRARGMALLGALVATSQVGVVYLHQTHPLRPQFDVTNEVVELASAQPARVYLPWFPLDP